MPVTPVQGIFLAIYHFSLSIVQRSKGQSIVAIAADRARVKLYDNSLGILHAPQRHKSKNPPILSEILLPPDAPERWCHREVLWNEVEAAEVRRDASLAREVEFAIPSELSQRDAMSLARAYAVDAFISQGMIGDINVHWAVRPDGLPKPYAQILVAMRRSSPEGFGLKERSWNDRSHVLRWRALWSEMANTHLAALGHEARIDHRSHAARGSPLEPQNKIGPNAARRARRGEPSERVDEHYAIAERNARVQSS